MTRGYYFGAGPAILPEQLLKEVQSELLEWHELGVSILEIGHRTPEFRDLLKQTEHKLRELLKIPSNYHVLFLGGSARSLFGMIPLNFLQSDNIASYLITGLWSTLAYQEAQKIRQAEVISSGIENGFICIPPTSSWHRIHPNSTYIYYTPNETVNGLYCPRSSLNTLIRERTIPIIADMTSCLLTEPLEINDYDLIFAGAQKNIANAGMTLIIIRDSMLDMINNPCLPTAFDFRTHVEHQSLYATPPTFNCYLTHKMLTWIEQKGGIESIYALNKLKAKKLYDFIDRSSLFFCKTPQYDRSFLNICFHLPTTLLEDQFVEQAKEHHLLALRGHQTIGGLRASLYNAMPMKGVDMLIQFMAHFESTVSE